MKIRRHLAGHARRVPVPGSVGDSESGTGSQMLDLLVETEYTPYPQPHAEKRAVCRRPNSR